MNTSFPRISPRPAGRLVLLAAWAVWAWPAPSLGADFRVTSPGSFFAINSQQPNPTLTVVRGETYNFSVSTASNHPFRIISPAGTTDHNDTSSGTITFRVPADAPASYRYVCSVHGFSGRIDTVPPPLPHIVGVEVGENLTLRSTDTGGFTILPEFTTDLTAPVWQALAVETNRVANGTNETICGRPNGTNVFVRIKATRS